MSNIKSLPDRNPEDVLSLLQNAGNYVVSSDDLRASVLQKAREYQTDKKVERFFLQLGWGILVAAALLLPLADQLDAWMAKTTSPTSAEIEDAALRLSSERHLDVPSSTTEIYMKIREEQVERFRAIQE